MVKIPLHIYGVQKCIYAHFEISIFLWILPKSGHLTEVDIWAALNILSFSKALKRPHLLSKMFTFQIV